MTATTPMELDEILLRVNGRALASGRYESYSRTLTKLGVELRHNTTYDTFELVQLAAVHPCDRILATNANVVDVHDRLIPWRASAEAIETRFAEDLVQHLDDTLYLHEGYRREIGPIKNELFWLTRKMMRPYHRDDFFFRDHAAIMQGLQDGGLTNHDLHELIYHYPIWLMNNPDFTDMPHDIVLRMHGFGRWLDDRATPTHY